MNTISEQVKNFLHNNPQPRKEVVRFILKANCKKGTFTDDWFNENYGKQYRGYYSINFQEWERKGNITRTKGIYALSDGFYESGRGLYTEDKKVVAKRLKKGLNRQYDYARKQDIKLWKLQRLVNQMNELLNS